MFEYLLHEADEQKLAEHIVEEAFTDQIGRLNMLLFTDAIR